MIVKLSSISTEEYNRLVAWVTYMKDRIFSNRLNINDEKIDKAIDQVFETSFALGWICKQQSDVNADYISNSWENNPEPKELLVPERIYNQEIPSDAEWRSRDLELEIQEFESWVGRNYTSNLYRN